MDDARSEGSSVRRVVRWLIRHTILFVIEEWEKARIDAWAGRSTHRVDAATSAEIATLRASLANIERMHREAARAMARFPAAQDVIVRLLDERLEALVEAAHAAATQDREAA